jgi:hypothetical protein
MAPEDEASARFGLGETTVEPSMFANTGGDGGSNFSGAEFTRDTAFDCRIIETRTNDQCLDELAVAPTAFVAVELSDASRERGLELLSSIAERFPFAKVVVLADRGLRHYEWLARELGAVHFVASPRQLAPLATIISRHWQRTAPAAASDAETGRSIDDIWRDLPWG